MRLIDADEALRLFGEEYEETKELIHNGETQLDSLAEGFTEAHHIIKYVVPTVDAVPIVRCKDCKWFADNNDGDWVGCWLFQTIQIIPEDAPKPDDFCSYGERKEGAEC